MPRMFSIAALISVAVTSICVSPLQAQDPGQYMGYYAYPQPMRGPYPPSGAFPVSNMGYTGGHGYEYATGHYPNLDASLYPSPRPDIPQEVGGTIITNSALYPHEMLYPHTYRAIYPPFYYKRGLFGRRYHVTGTQVTVKYKGHISPFSLFFPPTNGSCP